MSLSIDLLIVITMLRKHKYKMMLEILVLLSFLVMYAAADTHLEGVINHLFKYIRESNCTFIRNNKEYDVKAAAEHIRKKYDHFKSEIHTSEDFIELCATKSLISGRPYLVKCRDGVVILCAEWLEKEVIKNREALRRTVP